jgi:hypothetical protein
MSGSSSKNKGKSWERDISRFLTSLYKQSFIRVPASGAYVGGKNALRKEFLHEGQIRNMKGDITPPMDWKHFNCEAKNYADFPFHQLTKGSVSQLEKWIEQCLTSADHNDYNLIIIKISRKGTFIVTPQLEEINPGKNYFSYESEKYGLWYIIDYDNFWKLNKDSVEKLSKAQ